MTKEARLVAGCSKCADGYIRVPKDKSRFGFNYQICECLVKKDYLMTVKTLLKEANLPKKVNTKFALHNWNEADDIPFEAIKKIVQAGEKWLFLHGTVGTGKTFISLVASEVALMLEKSVYFTSVTSLLMDLRPSELEPTKAEEVMQKCLNADLLVLDDIGHEKTSEWVRATLYKIINHRWSYEKQTILTSNFAAENLKETVSDAVYSRVKGESLDIRLESEKDLRIS